MSQHGDRAWRKPLGLVSMAIATAAVVATCAGIAIGKTTPARVAPRVETSADALLAEKLDASLASAAEAESAALVDVMVFTHAGAKAPKQLVQPLRIRLKADKESYLYVGRVRGRDLGKLATADDVIRVEDNRPSDPPVLPDVPKTDPAKAKAAGKKIAARMAAATKSGDIAAWADSFDAEGKPEVAGAPSPAAASGGNAPTGWLDVGSTHKSAEAWADGFTGEGVLVGVADTGVDFAHPDLQGTQATVTADASPYKGWPLAYDPYSVIAFAYDHYYGTDYVTTGMSWFSDTSYVVTRGAGGTASLHGVTYVLPNTSLSGNFHMGYSSDEQLGTSITGYASGWAPILVTDEHTAGVYDTVYIDLNGNEDFTDDKPCTKDSPISYLDFWDSEEETSGADGYADLSGGMIYWIADGTNNPPGFDLHFNAGAAAAPGAGDLVCIMGSLDYDDTHGTLCASNIVGQGVIDGASIADEYPSFKGAGTGGIVQGAGRDAKLVGIGNIYSSSSTYVMAYDFAAFGLDGDNGTGDELQSLSCSFGDSAVDNDGWDYESRYITMLNDAYSPSTVFVFSTGNGGPGYGTNAPPSPSTGISVGASTQFGACGGWDSITTTDQVTVGDVISWSNRGPSALGDNGVSVVADGAYSSGAVPLNNAIIDDDHLDGWRAWEIWGGTSRSTPVAVGNLALVQQAFKAQSGRWPTWSEARNLMMSGATDLSYDSFVQGAGMVNAKRSTALAAQTGGLLVSPPAWTAGDFRGTKRNGFANIMHAGDVDSTSFTISNSSDAPADVNVSDAWHQRAWTKTIEVTITPADESEYDFNRPDFLRDITGDIAAGTDLLVIRTVYPLDEMDPSGEMTPLTDDKNDVRVLAYDWSDADVSGDLWTDGDADGLVDDGEIDAGEYERFTYGYGRGTSHEIRVQNPLDRMHDGVFLGLQHRNRGGGGLVHVKVELSGWNRVDWPWLTVSDTSFQIAAGSARGIDASIAVPADAPLGAFDGQILVSQGTTTTVVPVTVNVAGDGATIDFGGTSSYETLMDNTKVFGYQDWNWRPEAGDWRFFMADVPDTVSSAEGAKWLVHTSWDSTPTDIDSLLYGPTPRDIDWPTGDDSFFGPYDLTYKGGSANANLGAGRWGFQTATNDASEWVAGALDGGLNEIMLHNVLYAGTTIGSGFSGNAGVVSSTPASCTARSALDTGTVSVSFSTSIDLPGLTAAGYGLAKRSITDAVVGHESSWESTSFVVDDAAYVDVTTANDTSDVDLYVQRWSGTSWIDVAGSESSSGNEHVRLVAPENGTYRAQVYGYSVPSGTDTVTVTQMVMQGNSLAMSGLPIGTVSAGTTHTIPVQWTMPQGAANGETYEGVVYLGIPGAPQIIEIPVSLEIDFDAPAAPAALAATKGYKKATLSWTNPAGDYASTRILRSSSGYATTATSTVGQTVVFDSAGTTCTATGLTAYKRYYFTAFTRDTSGNWSVAAKATAVAQGHAKLSRPKVYPSTPRHGKKFKVTGTISKHTSKTYVYLKFYKKSGASYSTTPYKTVKVTIKAKKTSYTAYTSLGKKASYRLRAYHSDSKHAGSYSSSRYFKTK